MHTPYFSIVIPAYNCESFICDALESIGLQSCKDWETLIAADTTSSDDTVFTCINQSVISRDKVRVIPVGHIGQYAARRHLVELSKGEVIVSLDADDRLISHDALKIIKNKIQINNCDMVMFNGTRSLSRNDSIVDYSRLCQEKDGRLNIKSLINYMLTSYELNNIWLKAFKRSKAAFNSNGRILHNTEDRLQCIELLTNIESCYLIDEPFYFYRTNHNSVTQSTYKYSYFEDALYVESRANELLMPLCRDRVSIRERRLFLCETVAMLLQMLFETSDDREHRLQMYESIRSYGLELKVLPKRTAIIRPDYAMMYSHFIKGSFMTLDRLLQTKKTIKSIISN